MSAAQPLYTDDPRHYGAAALCSALGDPEDSHPAFFCRPMNDQDDSREATTLAPDTDRADRDTSPPGPDDAEATRVLSTMLPPNGESELGKTPKTLEDTYLDRAIRVVANAGSKLDEDREERRLQHAAVLEAIRRSDENQTRNYELLRDEVRHLKESDRHQDRRLAEGDERFAQIENSIEALKDELLAAIKVATADAARRIGALESELKELKANAARTAQAPSAVTP